MGFYVAIYITFHLCQETGKPFFYSKNYEKVYDLSLVPEVPLKYRRFLDEQGNRHLQFYMRDDHYYDSAEAVLDNFPKWEDVKDCLCKEAKRWWTEEDHNLFHEAMEWFASSGTASYTVQWG